MMVRVFIFLFLFTLKYSISNAQIANDFIPDHDYKIDKTKLDLILAKFEEDAKAIDIGNAKAEKDIIETIKGHVKDIRELNDLGILIFNDTITNYLNTIVKKIKSKNSILDQSNFFVFSGKDPDLNASSYGEGIIVFNVALLEQLETEGEIAFVLAHEMAHDYLKHLWKRVTNKAKILNDPEFKKEIRKAISKEYNAYKSIDSVLSIYVTEIMTNSRANELQADSLGLRLLLNTGYSYKNAESVLVKLDSIDYFNFKDSLKLNEFFGFKDYPFKNEWLEYTDESTWGVSKGYNDIPDSLKTHPNCQMRIMYIENENGIDRGGDVNALINTTDFDYKLIFSFYNLEALLESENSDYALFLALNLVKNKEEHFYVKAIIVESLYTIWKAKKMYRFSKVVGNDRTTYPKCYNDFLHYLHTINAGVFMNHTYQYYEQHVKGKFKGEYADYLNLLIQSLEKEDNIMKKEVQLFKQKYGESYYYNLLNLRLNLNQK